MLTISNSQMSALELDFFQRQCIQFLRQELRIFDCEFHDMELLPLFEQFHSLLDTSNHDERLTLVLLLIASFAFDYVFTQQAIARFLSEPMTPVDRRQRLQHALLQHTGYDAEFLRRKTWI